MLTFKDTAHRFGLICTTLRVSAPDFAFKWEPPIDAPRNEAVAAAKRSDLVIAFLGLSPEIEGEEMPVHLEGFDGGDRSAIELLPCST